MTIYRNYIWQDLQLSQPSDILINSDVYLELYISAYVPHNWLCLTFFISLFYSFKPVIAYLVLYHQSEEAIFGSFSFISLHPRKFEVDLV